MAALNRRRFLQASAGTVAVAASVETVAKAAASERVRVGCIGAGGRALSLVTSFANNPNCEVVAIADLDSRRFGPVGSSGGGGRPSTIAASGINTERARDRFSPTSPCPMLPGWRTS